MLKLYINNTEEVEVNVIRFPAGESLVNIHDAKKYNRSTDVVRATITCNFTSNSDIIDLLLLTDAIRRYYYTKVSIHLNIPYFPYARQDRVCNKGESLSVKVIADLINSQNYDKVCILDPHSDVTPSLINNCHTKTLAECAIRLRDVLDKNNTILISPDAGANKKVYDVAKEWKFPEVVRADKTRNVETGKITGTKLFIDPDKYKYDVQTMRFTNKDCLILDDICDGGYTFIQLAKELREFTTGRIILYVTHGVFSKGLDVLKDAGFDCVYVSNDMQIINTRSDTFLRNIG